MPPRLPSFSAFKAPSASMARIARPFSSTPAVAESSNPVTNLLDLEDKPRVHSADRLRGLMNLGGKPGADGSASAAAASAAFAKRTLTALREKKTSDDYVKQMPRRWRTGDLYAPHDLSPVEMSKWRRVRRPNADVLDMLNINPLDHYKNFSMMSEYMSPFGQILSAKETGLRAVNQRRMSKAIRRAIGMGIHPSVHHHPELLKNKFRMR